MRKLALLRDELRVRGLDSGSMAWLDVGCGRGDLLRVGGADFRVAVGCDPSRAMLAACDGLSVAPMPASGELPFEEGTFDLVTAVCVYHHVEPAHRPSMTGELLRVLRPGGIAAIIEHNPANPITRLIVGRTPVDANARLLAPRDARRLLERAEFHGTSTRSFLYLPERLYPRLARVEAALAGIPLGGQYAVFARR